MRVKRQVVKLPASGIAIEAREDIVAEKGDYLVVDPDTEVIVILTPEQFGELYETPGEDGKRKKLKMSKPEEREASRNELLHIIFKANERVATADLRARIHRPHHYVFTRLKELEAQGMVVCERTGSKQPVFWTLTKGGRDKVISENFPKHLNRNHHQGARNA